MKITYFTYDADCHCIECAVHQYGREILKSCEGLVDSEGNEPGVAFDTDDGPDYKPTCGSCGELIDI